LSRKDFSARIGIAHKEARETNYWLRLLCDSGLIERKLFDSMSDDCEEILKISGSILKTLKKEN